jgi:hypothetical protein
VLTTLTNGPLIPPFSVIAEMPALTLSAKRQHPSPIRGHEIRVWVFAELPAKRADVLPVKASDVLRQALH